jgi:hypothetical protein
MRCLEAFAFDETEVVQVSVADRAIPCNAHVKFQSLKIQDRISLAYSNQGLYVCKSFC